MKTIQITDEDYEFLQDLQHELNTQTNDGNADPVYWGVMEHRMEPAPEGFGDAIIYMGDGATMTTEEAVEYINENIADYSEDVQDEWKEKDDFDRSDMPTVVDFLHDTMQLHECRIVWQEEKDFIRRETGAFITKRACKEYIKKIIHVWVEGNIRWGIEYNSKHEWYRGCKPCDFIHLPGYGTEVYHIREIIKQWNKFAKPSRRFHVDFDDNYKGITYDKCLQILKVLNVKRK